MPNPRVLLVDDNDNVRVTLKQVLELEGFEVVGAAGVNEALALIAGTTMFDVLLSDLHMPGRGDGLTVVSAMRHANPDAVTLVLSGYPEMQAATDAILLQTDEILMKPLDASSLVETIRRKLQSPSKTAARITASVATILENDNDKIIDAWLERVNHSKELLRIPLSTKERTGHLPLLLNDLTTRLRQPLTVDSPRRASRAAQQHGWLRRNQGYTVPLVVEESRMLQVTIFEVLQLNLFQVDFSLVLTNVMTI